MAYKLIEAAQSRLCAVNGLSVAYAMAIAQKMSWRRQTDERRAGLDR
jgi:hypothetical protein